MTISALSTLSSAKALTMILVLASSRSNLSTTIILPSRLLRLSAASKASRCAAAEHQFFLGANIHGFQILRGDFLIAPMARHFLALAHATGIRPVADRATVAKILVRTMRTGKAGERPTLDDARKAVPLGNPRNIDAIADFEEIAGFDLLTKFVGRHIIDAEFFEDFEGAFASFRHMTLRRFVDPLCLLGSEADLECVVTVRR